MRRIADLHVGHSKSDQRDAFVIAHAARSLPHVLCTITGEEESVAELCVLCTFDDDLVTQISGASNHYRALLAKIHPALERAVGPRLAHPAMLDLLQDYASPEALRAAGHERIESRLLVRAPRIGSQMADDIERALNEQFVIVPGTRGSGSVLVRHAGLSRRTVTPGRVELDSIAAAAEPRCADCGVVKRGRRAGVRVYGVRPPGGSTADPASG
ncbi:IS110 family transposase [Microbacterium sp. 22296]|uniref:IS110 family transposase n=1 Tax=Microbacterium sp. 22296 TaxID=3453903 RepID=UPI003F83E731